MSSSWTILMICWAGLSACETSAPRARSFRLKMKDLTTGSATSASSSARRISRAVASMSASVSLPLPRSLVKIPDRRSLRLSNTVRWSLGRSSPFGQQWWDDRKFSRPCETSPVPHAVGLGRRLDAPLCPGARRQLLLRLRVHVRAAADHERAHDQVEQRRPDQRADDPSDDDYASDQSHQKRNCLTHRVLPGLIPTSSTMLLLGKSAHRP